jgi:hypothetical protein
MQKDKWAIAASSIVKSELAKRNLNYIQLKEKLAKIGIYESEVNIRGKIARGSFNVTFFLQCLTAIGVKEVSLDAIELITTEKQ